MKPTPPTLGCDPDGYAVSIDTDKLVESRLLIAATSGQGKSWALRRILEQTHGAVQHIVIDPEGEFFTLREVFDYVLARAGHADERDCPAEVRSAGLLARKLLELGVSAVVDIYDLKPADRTMFVKLFLESVMEVPRSLWHPALIVLDETHLFAPQSGDSASGQAVADLFGRGRKRGFAGCACSQRYSKVNKDVAAMCQNVLIGGFTLDVDVVRAVDSLGFVGKSSQAEIRELRPGNFFVQGPAFSREVRRVMIGTVQTTHPKAGQRAPLPAIPRAKIKSILDQLANLPAEGARQLKTEAGLRAEVKRLELELAKVKREAEKLVESVQTVQGPQAIQSAHRAGFDDAQRQFDEFLDNLKRQLVFGAEPLLTYKASQQVTAPVRAPQNGKLITIHDVDISNPLYPPGSLPCDKLPKGARRLLGAALTWYGKGLSEGTWRAAAQLRKSGTYDTYKSKLLTLGLIEMKNELIYATDAGLKYAGTDIPPTPQNTDEVLALWNPKLQLGARRMLQSLISANRPMEKEELGEASGLAHSGGSFDTYLSSLKTANLIVRHGKQIEVNREVLFL
jgi:hypothetical protein